jgi:hypothetical protein
MARYGSMEAVEAAATRAASEGTAATRTAASGAAGMGAAGRSTVQSSTFFPQTNIKILIYPIFNIEPQFDIHIELSI